jgi:outer membrane receptor protein involved in Fe transport
MEESLKTVAQCQARNSASMLRATLAGWLLAGVAQAQDAPALSPPESGQTETLQEVIVTATKREQSVRDIPETVNAISGADLEASGAREMSDYLNRVPGVALQQNGSANDAQISFRGIAPQSGGNQTVGELIGDVPMTEPISTLAGAVIDVDPFDLKDVEILKGPQGTTFGASGLNGAIRWVPEAPQYGVWGGRAFVDHSWTVDGGNAPNYGAVGNVPIGGHAGVRLLGIYHDAPGFIDNEQRKQPHSDRSASWTGRAIAKWDPFERLSLTGMYMRQQTEQYDQSLADNLNGSLTSDDRPGPSHVSLRFDLASIDARYRFDWATLVAQSSRATKDLISGIDLSNTIAGGNLGLQTLRAYLQGNSESYVEELRLVSNGDGSLSWIGGVFFQDYRLGANEQFNIPNTTSLSSLLGVPVLGNLLSSYISPQGLVLTGDNFSPLNARERAAFGELTWRPFHFLELSGGARLYRTEVSAFVEDYGVDRDGLTTSPLQPDHSFDQQNKGVNPKGTVKLTITDNIMLYGNAARGYQFGGINLTPAILPNQKIPQEFSSSNLWNYEAGLRTNWFGRKLYFDVTPFYIDWSNAQITQTTPVTSTQFVANVGAAKSKGLEGGLAWVTPIPGLSLSLNGMYDSSKTAVPFTSNGKTAPAGTVMPQAPKWQASNTISYKLRLDGWLSELALQHAYQGGAYSDVFHSANLYNYNTLNLNFSVSRPDLPGAPSLSFGAANLTDARAVVGAFPQLDHTEGVYNRPRTLSARFSVEY